MTVECLIIYVCIRSLIWRARVENAERQDYLLKHRPDGRAYPPFGRGLCDNCNQAFEKVYFLPSGTRLCPDCYQKTPENE